MEEFVRFPDTAQIEADLAESEADVTAGRTVSLGPALQRMRDSIERMEARRVATSKASVD